MNGFAVELVSPPIKGTTPEGIGPIKGNCQEPFSSDSHLNGSAI